MTLSILENIFKITSIIFLVLLWKLGRAKLLEPLFIITTENGKMGSLVRGTIQANLSNFSNILANGKAWSGLVDNL